MHIDLNDDDGWDVIEIEDDIVKIVDRLTNTHTHYNDLPCEKGGIDFN